MLNGLIGLLGSLLIAGIAYRFKSLSRSGAAAAIVLGTLLCAFGSLAWFGLLIVFFVSSSLLSKYKKRRKALVEQVYEKSGRRDMWQVIANGGLGLLLCIGNAAVMDIRWYVLYIGVLAAVTADTWATEWGGLSKAQPRSIITGKVVPAGVSGGVTWRGIGASAFGGLFIGLAAAAFAVCDAQIGLDWRLCVLLGFIGGMVGSLIDSLMGALWQSMRRCPHCGRELESRIHCNQPTVHSRGFRWLNNDAVNALASLIGAAATLLAYVVAV